MKIKFLCFFIFYTSFGFTQVIISGKLYNEGNQPIPYANITITNIATDQIITYGITNNEGEYTINLEEKAENLQINVRSLGYEQVSKILENKSQIQNFVLKEQFFLLNEVIVKNQPITKHNDTINYSVNAFSNEQDRSIADVIRRMPGIEVLSNGQILYEGTPINKYYIEGLDLLEGKYNLANENLPHKSVARVQILENHQPIRILDSLVFSERAALNIQLKNKNTFTGQAKVGSGFNPLLWDVNLTPMLFSKNKQMLASYQTNNSGKNIASQLNVLSFEAIIEQFENNSEKKDWLEIQRLNPPNFSESRWLDNNTHLFSTNILQKLKKDYEIRLNISYLNDYQKQDGSTQTLFFTPADTISLFESKYNQLFYNSLETNLTLQKNTKKNYFKNSLQFKGYWDSQRGTVLREDVPLIQNLSNHFFNVSNNFNTVFPMGKQLITLNSTIGLSNTPQNLQVNPGQFEEILSDGFSIEEIIQNINLQAFYTNNSISFTKSVSFFTFSPRAGLQLESQKLESHLFTNENQNIDNDFFNNLGWTKTKTYVSMNTEFRKQKWQISLNTPFNFHSYQIEDKPLGKQQVLNRFTFDPRLSINYDINTMWKIRGAAGIGNAFGTINQIHYAYILQNYRSLKRVNSPLPETFTKTINGSISYRNPIKALFGNILYTYSHNQNNLLYENQVLPSGATEINAVLKDNTRNSHNISGRISKYFIDIRSSLSISTVYGINNFELLLNDILTEIGNFSHKVEGKLDTDFTKWFNTEYRTSFLSSFSKIQNQESRKNKQQSHQLNLNTYITKQHFLSLRTEYLKNDLFSNINENIFSDLLYRFSFKDKNIDLELHWSNIFNTKNYRTIEITEYRFMETNYNLRPSQILLNVRFSL